MKTKLGYVVARSFAERVVNELRPVCARIEIAGSIRRMHSTVGDIELLCVPKFRKDLLGEEYGGSLLDEKLASLVSDGRLERVQGGSRYKQFAVKRTSGGLVYLDIFVTVPEKWGVQLLIRTGSAEFSKKMVTHQNRGGWLPNNMLVSGGRLWRSGVALDTHEEQLFFDAIGMDYVLPEKREVA